MAGILLQPDRQAERQDTLPDSAIEPSEQGHAAGPLGTLALPALFTRQASDSALGVELA